MKIGGKKMPCSTIQYKIVFECHNDQVEVYDSIQGVMGNRRQSPSGILYIESAAFDDLLQISQIFLHSVIR